MTTVDADRANFESWYAEVLASLYPNREAGVAVFMLTLPLAERLLRQVNGVGPDQDLTNPCMATLGRLFPALAALPVARQFWATYRHGFLHQVSLSRSTRRGAALPLAWLSHDTGQAVEVHADGSFWVHPILFSQAVVAAIRADFGRFVGKGSPGTPLPGTVIHVGGQAQAGMPSTYIGTGGRS